MSTRSFIGIQHKDGTVTSVYCHHDGEDHGTTLTQFYSKPADVDALISYGDMSSLGSTFDTCSFYTRDHNEPKEDTRPGNFDNMRAAYASAKASDAEYFYVFRKSAWYTVRITDTGIRYKLATNKPQKV